MPGRVGAEHEVVEQREQVERQRGAVQPDTIGVQIAERQAAQADAELCVFDALFDLRAVAVVALDRHRVAIEIGEDEAIAVDDVGLAGQPQVELLARDRARAPRAWVIGQTLAWGATLRTINRSGSCSQPLGEYVVSATSDSLRASAGRQAGSPMRPKAPPLALWGGPRTGR